MWRPPDWGNARGQAINKTLKSFNPFSSRRKLGRALFEAGADALLEALRKSPGAKRIEPEWGYHNYKGYTVFIPDEK